QVGDERQMSAKKVRNTNADGKVNGQPPAAPVPANKANPNAKKETPKEKNILEKTKDKIDNNLDQWVEQQGYSPLAMGAGALGKALNEVFMPTAWWEIVPVGKAGKILNKGANAIGMGKKSDEAAAATKQARKEAAEKKGKKGGQTKPKKKMKCGEYGKYGELQKKTGDNKFDRDHIPSKAALKERAQSLLKEGRELSSAQKKAIEKWGDSIAIPKQAHIDISPTYGQTTAEAIKDLKNLAGAARRDVEAMLKNIDAYDADGGCKKAYQKASKRVLRHSNEDFDKALKDILKKVK
ncbi:hypothetical protein, partial [Chitinibacter sp. GC72]|uniref:hypothetical protein n=1 Tax=Chitinibacter sp. GC72 TaxID=1526917 RepID=UPI001E51160D